ncbi:UvrD-helicase domain-containing protein [Anaerococcus sp. NML200574]|uniref:UvrD-helicase domain-containing protein n=1 Tax=Anaerococcus sp. NML200574 TaxID=2954486 RepID=UPI0022385222|nr:UvrD-helicase domain-containing protein [Anaerococcus sp. NML200574]MCW6678664.1 UvrD-helicase domain-containing protein [Anaerococcus sp. NML200574]
MTEIKKTKAQEAAIDTEDKNIIVSAAAGSGKTFVLVERIISLMKKYHIDIDQMIIVTFTNKSAIDMKNKIRTRLEEAADDFDPAFLKRQIKLLKTAQIKTLHAFCSDMIRENFYYFDKLSPNFKVLTENTSIIMRANAIDEIFDEEYEKMTDDFRIFLENFAQNRNDSPAKGLIQDTYNMIIGQIDPLAWLDKNTRSANIGDKLKEISKKALRDMKDKAFKLTVMANENDMREKLQELVTEDYSIFLDLENNLDSWEEFLEKIEKVKFGRLSSSKNDDKFLYSILRTDRNSYKNSLDKLKNLVRNTSSDLISLTSHKEEILLGEINRLTRRFMEAFDQKKKAKSYLDFNDLEQYFIRLLDNETARNKLVDKFEYIFFDEYQDSNEIQNYIIEKLKRERRLFFVGDVKQSIYGFRRARPDLFLEKLDIYEREEDSVRINLNENFRTDKLLLDFNNYIFDRIMTKETSGIDYKNGGHRLNFGRDKENPNAKVGLKVLDKAVNEEDYLVKLIRDLVGEGYAYKDIAIVLRSGNKSYVYEEAFKRADIPYFNDISKVSFLAAEVNFFINLLKYLANPNDDIVLLSVLRSEIFNFSEDDLVEIKLKTQSYRFYDCFENFDGNEQIKAKIDNFKLIIKDLKNKLAIYSLFDFANYLFEKTGLYDFLMARDLGADRINNIESLIDLMAEYDSANDNGLYGFLTYYENISKTQKDTIDQSRDLSEEEDLVRIMTIHKSKGLEFKVVILADSSRTIRNMHSSKLAIFDDKLGIGIDVADYDSKVKVSSINKKLIENKLIEEDKKEEMRILYVGLTRAEERLYITGTKSQSSLAKLYQNVDYLEMSSHLDWILSSLSFDKIGEEIFAKDYFTDDFDKRVDISYLESLEDEKVRESRDIGKIFEDIKPSANYKKIEDLMDFVYKGADDIGESLKKSVTEIAKDFNKEEEGYERSSFGENYSNIDFKKPDFIEEEKTYSATDKGSLIHKVFQKLPMKEYDKKSLKAEIEILIENQIIEKEGAKLLEVDKFLGFFQNDLIKELIKEETPYRKEESFLMQYEDYYVNGQIDLIFEKEDEIILIDFKTDRIKREEAYKKQLEIYKKALEEALGKKVSMGLIYWYNSGEISVYNK